METTWLDRTQYPFESHFFEIEGCRLHYVDEGRGEPILFVHGTPSWSFDFRHLMAGLRSRFRCLAIDHIGFGLSDKPARYPYSTRQHSQNLERFVLEKDLRDLTLVVHDFGGPIGLSVAIRHPDRIKRIVVLNSWLWSAEADPEFQRLAWLLRSPILSFLYRHLNISPRFLLPASFGKKKLPREIHAQYLKPFARKSDREGLLAFARSLLNDQDWFEELWKSRTPISAKPVLFVWGMKDALVAPHHLEKFQAGFSQSRALRLDTCGHFPQEEEPEETLRAIREFLFETKE